MFCGHRHAIVHGVGGQVCLNVSVRGCYVIVSSRFWEMDGVTRLSMIFIGNFYDVIREQRDHRPFLGVER